MRHVLPPALLVRKLIASTVAIFQGDVKRMLAYSSVAQIGYIVLGLSLDTVAGVTASLLHLFNHALMKAALFMAVALFFYRVGSMRLADLGGIGRKMPWTFAALVLGGLSLIGVPLTTGFVSKWYLVQEMLSDGRARAGGLGARGRVHLAGGRGGLVP